MLNDLRNNRTYHSIAAALFAILSLALFSPNPAISSGIENPLEKLPFLNLIAFPDTQHYAENYPDIFMRQVNWVKERKDSMNIIGILHEGDIVNRGNSNPQWMCAENAIDILDGVVPYCLAFGNHDWSYTCDKYFPVSKFNDKFWFGGNLGDNMKNAYYFIGDMELLVLCLDYEPTQDVLIWANEIVSKFSSHQAIIVTHSYLKTGDKRTKIGNYIWKNLVSKHDNIFLVLCGHIHGTGRLTTIRGGGKIVHQILADYQSWENGGDGYLRIMEFQPQQDKIYVKTYSPYKNSWLTDSDNDFELDYDMDATAPPSPGGLTLNRINEYDTALSWNASVDNESAIIYYKIYRNGKFIAKSRTTGFIDKTTQNSSDFNYKVSAVNSFGLESGLSN